jgi:hypothetical protein
MARPGRKRLADIPRQPNGQPARSRRPANTILPEAALDRRAEGLGVDGARLRRTGRKAIAALCADRDAGTALGRLTWRFGADGKRQRRLGDFGAIGADGLPVLEPVVTDAMEAGADAYRTLWARWHRMAGLPKRHPRIRSLERIGGGSDDGADPVNDDPALQARIGARLRRAAAAMATCPHPQLVRIVVESVVIDDVLPDPLRDGERETALLALRRGLDALHECLCRTRGRRGVKKSEQNENID